MVCSQNSVQYVKINLTSVFPSSGWLNWTMTLRRTNLPAVKSMDWDIHWTDGHVQPTAKRKDWATHWTDAPIYRPLHQQTDLSIGPTDLSTDHLTDLPIAPTVSSNEPLDPWTDLPIGPTDLSADHLIDLPIRPTDQPSYLPIARPTDKTKDAGASPTNMTGDVGK